MADKPAPVKWPALTPLFFILLVIIVAGLGSIRWCAPYYGYQERPPSNRGGVYDSPRPGPDIETLPGYPYYTILVGRFENRDRAAAVAAELRAKRVNNFIVQFDGRWLVCVGRYMSRDRAKQMVDVLETHGVENARILRPMGK
jgi:hypothetical protein